MATVFLAQDVRHGRPVALKVLRPELAAVIGAERFLTEIRVTAGLRHPNLLPLFDSGEADSFLFYVMPYVEGETLRDRLERENQLPIEESVRIASEVAEALHAAHEQGVIHRDIKPANILMSRSRPLVSDFGIALAVTAAGDGRMTETGLSLGTPHYMSPEQATGDQRVGPRTDVYALGCVLYEMLVGEPPFTGSNAQAILGRIISGDPVTATRERASVPAHVDAAIRKALEKLPADRFSDAQDFARALADPAFRHGEAGPPAATGAGGAARLAVASTIVAVLFGAAAAWGWLRPMPSPSAPTPLRAALLFPADSGPAERGLALSPDGKELAFVTLPNLDGARIWIRSLETGRRRVLEGTEGASEIAWSPLGDRIAYRLGTTEIRVVPVGGGPPTTAASLEGGVGPPHWDHDGSRLLFAAEGGLWSALDEGGEPTLVFPTEDPLDTDNGVVEVLPGGRRFLASALSPPIIDVLVGDFETGEMDRLLERSGNPHYEDGWLLRLTFGPQGPAITLVAQRFDPESLTTRGPVIPLAVGIPTPFGNAQMAARGNTVVFTTRESRPGLAWVGGGADGSMLPGAISEPGWMHELSGDGTRIATGGFRGLWLTMSDGGLPRQIGEQGLERAFRPRWSPDGSRILYEAGDGLRAIGTRAGDSARLVEPWDESSDLRAVGWGPGGEILFIAFAEDGSSELRASDDGGGGAARVLQPGASDAFVSPDGQWIAYVSQQGRSGPQVLVRSWAGGVEQRISTDGGLAPRWAPSGDAVYYVTPTGGARVVSLTLDGGIRASPPRAIPADLPISSVMPHPDGRLLLVVGPPAMDELTVLRDWQGIDGGG